MVALAAKLRWFLGACCFVSCGALAAVSTAYAQDDALSGLYRPSSTSVTATVATWGEDCGPRPQSHTLPAPANVTVQQSEGQLALKFSGYVLRTNACWSPNPAVKRTNHSASATQWASECATPQGDPKRETARYIVHLKSPTTLELVNESEYLWQLKNSMCTAKVRSVQQLQRMDATTASSQASAESASCTFGGTVDRIKLRPAEATLEPGERICFGVRAFDAAGCSRDLKASEVGWALEKAESLRATLSGGCFRAAESAAEAEGTFRVTASHTGKRDQASVKVSITDLSDITAGRIPGAQSLQSGEEGAQGGLASAGVKALGIETDSPWAVLLGGAALLLLAAITAWWFLARNTIQPVPATRERMPLSQRPVEALSIKAPNEDRSVSPEPLQVSLDRAPAPFESPVPAHMPASASVPPVAPQEAMICPVCRRGYAASATRCDADGALLLTYTAFVQQSTPRATTACAGCGQMLAASATFCGQCGHRTQQ